MEHRRHPLPENYAQMNDEEKITHWFNYIYRGMRCAGEDGCDEMAMLDKAELESYRATDPDIDMFMPYILGYLARMWMEPVERFVGRVNSQMGTDFEVVVIPAPKRPQHTAG